MAKKARKSVKAKKKSAAKSKTKAKKKTPPPGATSSARANFASLITQAAKGADPVLLTRYGKAVAAMVSIDDVEILAAVKRDPKLLARLKPKDN
jgi:prevent-host-death family protein